MGKRMKIIKKAAVVGVVAVSVLGGAAAWEPIPQIASVRGPVATVPTFDDVRHLTLDVDVLVNGTSITFGDRGRLDHTEDVPPL